MAKTQDLKRRIRSIRNTMQLTKAMKMVSAAKLRRAQERMSAARPYAERSRRILGSLAARVDPEINPLLERHGDKRIELVVVTADRGLCGAFNAQLIRRVQDFLREYPDAEIKVLAVGKKSREWFRRRTYTVQRSWVDIFRKVEFAHAREIGQEVIEAYREKRADRIFIAFNEFKSAIQASPVIAQLLPIEPEKPAPGDFPDEYIYEPDAESLIADLLPHYVEVQVFHALLESAAAEHAARMTAMENATKNAGELIENLTLTMNRVRQASITTEIIEIVSGATALESRD